MRARALAVARWNRSPLIQGVGPFWLAVLLGLAALVVFLFTAAGVGPILLGAVLVVPVAMALWQRPMIGLLALAIAGPIHQFLMLLLFSVTGSALVLKFAQLWKEGLVLLLLAKAIDGTFRRRTAPRIAPLDLLVLSFFALGAFYLIYPNQVGDNAISLKLLGLRADAFFLVAYFVGRGLTLTTRQVRVVLIAALATAFVIALVAAVQFVLPGATNVFFDILGLREFMALKLGDQASSFAIRQNYVSGYQIPRAASLLLSDLALAFYTLLAAPLAAGLLLSMPRLRDRLLSNVLLLATLMTTLLTVTRSAMIAMVPALGTVMVRGRGLLWALVIAVEATVVVVPMAHRLEITPSLLQDIFSPNEASARGHIDAVTNSLDVLREEPFGRGLGTAGQVSQIYAADIGITNESWYLQIATEMGIAASVVFAAVVAGFAATALLQYGRVRDPWLKSLCLGMTGAAIGFGIVGLTLHVWDGQTTDLLFWVLAGMVVQAPAIEAVSQA